VFSNGANDVLVVRGDRERMIPFARPDYVRELDFDGGRIVVDWDADF
jgi:16S rRNA processing protein RimM